MSNSSYVPPVPGTPAPKKGTPYWLWGLIGCGGLIVVVIIVLLVGGAYLWQKVPKTGTGMLAKVIELANPDVEVVELDEEKGVVTIKDKKTGAVTTVNLEDAKQGKITVTKDGKTESMTMGQDGDSVKIETDKGTATFGAAPKNLPDWLPAYPGVTPEGGMSMEDEGRKGGTLTFKTTDPPAKVIGFYKDNLAAAGLEQKEKAEVGADQLQIFSARSTDDLRSVTVTASRSEEQTSVSVTFEEKLQ